MFTKVRSATVIGIEGSGVDVEVDFSRRALPNFKIVGLPHKSVAEAKERVRSALRNAGFTIPAARVTVNLAPADSPKRGAHFDLPIAVGLLVSAGVISPSAIENTLFVGELSMEGSVSPISGVVPIALYAKSRGVRALYIPHANSLGVSALIDCPIMTVRSLSDMVARLRKPEMLSDRPLTSWSDARDEETHVALPIQGQREARRALEIALAGGHHMYIKGPPGVGKTLLARSSPYLLPPLQESEFYGLLAIRSVSETVYDPMLKRPFVAPPCSITERELLGGGSRCEIGELTKSHGGVLYLDELPLFKKSVIDALRRPLDDRCVSVMCQRKIIQFPANTILIATGNVCPCGYLGHPLKACTCSQQAISSYNAKVSGPIRDRIDMHIHMTDVEEEDLESRVVFSLKDVQKRIARARELQAARSPKNKSLLNAQLAFEDISNMCPMDAKAKQLLTTAYKRLGFSARVYFSTIRVARTIADLDGQGVITKNHMAEALYYRE